MPINARIYTSHLETIDACFIMITRKYYSFGFNWLQAKRCAPEMACLASVARKEMVIYNAL